MTVAELIAELQEFPPSLPVGRRGVDDDEGETLEASDVVTERAALWRKIDGRWDKLPAVEYIVVR